MLIYFIERIVHDGPGSSFVLRDNPRRRGVGLDEMRLCGVSESMVQLRRVLGRHVWQGCVDNVRWDVARGEVAGERTTPVSV
jgi:hypothetical protein